MELADSLNCVGIEVRYRLPCASLDFFSIFAPRPLAGSLAVLQADRFLLAGHSILGAECVREAPSRAVWMNVKRLQLQFCFQLQFQCYVSICDSACELPLSIERLCIFVVFLILKDGRLGRVSERRSLVPT